MDLLEASVAVFVLLPLVVVGIAALCLLLPRDC
jgi:hypothetical protein